MNTTAPDSNQPIKRGGYNLDDATNQELEQQVETTLHSFEDNFYHQYPGLWWTTLIMPGVLLLGAVGVCWIRFGWLFTAKMIGAAAAAFFGLGRFVILFGQHESAAGGSGPDTSAFDFLSPFELFAMVTYMDIAVALLVAFHIGALFKAPIIGQRVHGLVEDARFVLESMPWMRNLALVGQTLFVAFPLASTGAIGGSVLGTLLGLSRASTFTCTVLGCLLGNGLLLLASDFVAKVIPMNNPIVKFGGISVILVLIVAMEIRYRRQKKKFHGVHEPENVKPPNTDDSPS
ncbi:MAG: small multi-drug export protein [Pirellulaceae bacterium]